MTRVFAESTTGCSGDRSGRRMGDDEHHEPQARCVDLDALR
jgi:hypothetical protein